MKVEKESESRFKVATEVIGMESVWFYFILFHNRGRDFNCNSREHFDTKQMI